MFRLDGKVAVVIGAGSGIGLAAATGLAHQGACVIGADLVPGASGWEVDVANAESVRKLLRGVVERHGGLHVVVTTPGINVRKPLLDYTVTSSIAWSR